MSTDAFNLHPSALDLLTTKVAEAGGEITIDVIYYLRYLIANDWRYFADIRDEIHVPHNAERFAELCITRISMLRTHEAVQECIRAVVSGHSVAGLVVPAGRAAAIEKVWRDRVELFMQYQAATDKVQALGRLPWIGFGLKYRLAQMFGVDVVMPDPHTRLVASHHGCTAKELCERLAAQCSLSAVDIQRTIRIASVAGFLNPRTGQLKGLSGESAPKLAEASSPVPRFVPSTP